jgi:alkylated DNA nucleotide flippase Atl1
MARSAIDKLNDPKNKIQIEHDIPQRMIDNLHLPADATMLISTPHEIDRVMRRVPNGKLTTITDIRSHLAKKHKTSVTCPLTTGIFVNIAARAAEEMRALGNADITPYWRTLKAGGALNDKYPGGIEAHRALLEREGYQFDGKGKTWRVVDFEKHLAKL